MQTRFFQPYLSCLGKQIITDGETLINSTANILWCIFIKSFIDKLKDQRIDHFDLKYLVNPAFFGQKD
jgi:hypothetical protein